MESILAAVSTLAILGGITAWVFAWRINNAWAEYTKRLIEETEKMNAGWIDFYRKIITEGVGNGEKQDNSESFHCCPECSKRIAKDVGEP